MVALLLNYCTAFGWSILAPLSVPPRSRCSRLYAHPFSSRPRIWSSMSEYNRAVLFQSQYQMVTPCWYTIQLGLELGATRWCNFTIDFSELSSHASYDFLLTFLIIDFELASYDPFHNIYNSRRSGREVSLVDRANAQVSQFETREFELNDSFSNRSSIGAVSIDESADDSAVQRGKIGLNWEKISGTSTVAALPRSIVNSVVSYSAPIRPWIEFSS